MGDIPIVDTPIEGSKVVDYKKKSEKRKGKFDFGQIPDNDNNLTF